MFFIPFINWMFSLKEDNSIDQLLTLLFSVFYLRNFSGSLLSHIVVHSVLQVTTESFDRHINGISFSDKCCIITLSVRKFQK